MAEETQGQKPSLSQAIDEAIEARLVDLHTAMPAEIVSYDSATALAQVKPHFKRKFVTQASATAIPVISNVPVMMPRTKSAHVRLPISKGDTGLLVFSERSLDTWLERSMDHDPKDSRHHSLADAVFIPGLFDKTVPFQGNARVDSIELRNRSGFMEIFVNGKLRIGNNREELISLLQDLTDVLASLTVLDTHPIGGGTWSLTPASIVQINQVKTRLNSLKGA